jgi:hypothetical protein
VVRCAVFVEVKLTNNLFLDIRVGVRSNDLERDVSLYRQVIKLTQSDTPSMQKRSSHP